MTVVEGLEREAKRLTSADHFDSPNITARQVSFETMYYKSGYLVATSLQSYIYVAL